jgi:hypothetical protein
MVVALFKIFEFCEPGGEKMSQDWLAGHPRYGHLHQLWQQQHQPAALQYSASAEAAALAHRHRVRESRTAGICLQRLKMSAVQSSKTFQGVPVAKFTHQNSIISKTN